MLNNTGGTKIELKSTEYFFILRNYARSSVDTVCPCQDIFSRMRSRKAHEILFSVDQFKCLDTKYSGAYRLSNMSFDVTRQLL